MCNDREELGHATGICMYPPGSWFLDRPVSSDDVWSYMLFLTVRRTEHSVYVGLCAHARGPIQRVFARSRMFPLLLSAMFPPLSRASDDPSAR